VRAVVDNETIAGLLDAELARNFSGFEQQMPEHPVIVRLRRN